MAFAALTGTLTLNVDEFDEGVDDAEQSIDSLESKTQSVGSSMQRAGGAMTAGVTLPLAGMAAQSARTAANFDEAMQQSIAVMDDVDEAMREDLEQTARDVANTTTMSADQAAESYYFLASAGLDAAESMEAMPQVAAFAEAGQMDMAEATDVATNVMSAYGLEAENMSEVTDVMTATVTNHNQTMEGMAGAFQNVAPAAASMGVEIEELAALTGALGDQGIQAEEAGTALSSIMRRFAKRSGEAGAVLDELNIQTTDANGNLLSMTEIFGQLEDANLSAAQSSALFGRQAAAGNALLNTGSETLKEYQSSLEDADGATKDVAETQKETLNAEMQIARSNLEDVGITIGATLVPMLSTLTGYIKGAAEWFQGLNETQQKTIMVAGGLLAALGPVLVMLGTLAQSVVALSAAKGTLAAVNMGALVPSLTAVRGAIMGIYTALGPVGVILGALTLAVTAFAAAWSNNWFSIRDHTENVVNAVGDLINWLIEKINAIPGVDIDYRADDVDFTSGSGGGSGGRSGGRASMEEQRQQRIDASREEYGDDLIVRGEPGQDFGGGSNSFGSEIDTGSSDAFNADQIANESGQSAGEEFSSGFDEELDLGTEGSLESTTESGAGTGTSVDAQQLADDLEVNTDTSGAGDGKMAQLLEEFRALREELSSGFKITEIDGEIETDDGHIIEIVDMRLEKKARESEI